MPVAEMLRRMDSAELCEWFAFYHLRANPPKPQQTPAEARAVLEAMKKASLRKQQTHHV